MAPTSPDIILDEANASRGRHSRDGLEDGEPASGAHLMTSMFPDITMVEANTLCGRRFKNALEDGGFMYSTRLRRYAKPIETAIPSSHGVSLSIPNPPSSRISFQKLLNATQC